MVCLGCHRNAKTAFVRIPELSSDGVMEIRNIIQSFETAPKTWQEMAAELRRQGSTMIEPCGILFSMSASIHQENEHPGKFLWLNLFRIYKESLTNVLKHSHAKVVQVELKITREALNLFIRDDGIGIMKERSLSRGISGMKARAEEIGGTVAIYPNNGTTVCLEIPILDQ
jgi:signal transduction histidine kinase